MSKKLLFKKIENKGRLGYRDQTLLFCLGLIPSQLIISYHITFILTIPQANELLFGGRKITAMEAYNLGLVSQVFWPTLMMQEVIPRAQNMATCSAKVGFFTLF